MKKLLLFVPLFFLFTGCADLFNFLASNPNINTYTVNVEGNKDVYLIQVNNTFSQQTSANIFSKIEKDNSRAITNENTINNDSLLNVENYFYNDTSFIEKINNDQIPLVKTKDNRSVYDEIQKVTYSKDNKKYFNVLSTDENNQEIFIQRQAELINQNEYCNVWYIEKDASNNPNLTDYNTFAKGKCQELAEKFYKLLPFEEKYFGKHEYSSHPEYLIDSQKRIDIIVTDILDDATDKQNSGTFGYFSPNDYYKNSKSNQSQCIYVDSFFLYKYPEHVYSTLLHEYEHLLEHTNKVIIKGLNVQAKQTWYSEMLAMLAEDMLGGVIGLSADVSPQNRISLFLSNYNNGFTTWFSGNDVLISYANAYVYGAYLIRNFGGLKLLSEILNNEYFGIDSINQALLKVSNNTIDFEYTLNNQFQIFFNGTYNLDKKEYSLNKEVVIDSGNKIGFNKIDILSIINKETNNNFTSLNEIRYLNTNRININPHGFYITYIGNNIDRYSFSGNRNLNYLAFEK